MTVCNVIDNLFDELFIQEISNHVLNIRVSCNNIANRKTYPYGLEGTHRLFGTTLFSRQSVNHINKLEPECELFFPILKRIEEVIDLDLYCNEISLNSQLFGQDGTEHTDSEYGNDDLTIIQFTTANWKPSYGGQFELIKPKGETEVYEYIPGRIIIFPSHIPHRGLSPTEPYQVRTSIAYRVKPLHKSFNNRTFAYS